MSCFLVLLHCIKLAIIAWQFHWWCFIKISLMSLKKGFLMLKHDAQERRSAMCLFLFFISDSCWSGDCCHANLWLSSMSYLSVEALLPLSWSSCVVTAFWPWFVVGLTTALAIVPPGSHSLSGSSAALAPGTFPITKPYTGCFIATAFTSPFK